jgi:hypothetical protein
MQRARTRQLQLRLGSDGKYERAIAPARSRTPATNARSLGDTTSGASAPTYSAARASLAACKPRITAIRSATLSGVNTSASSSDRNVASSIQPDSTQRRSPCARRGPKSRQLGLSTGTTFDRSLERNHTP